MGWVHMWACCTFRCACGYAGRLCNRWRLRAERDGSQRILPIRRDSAASLRCDFRKESRAARRQEVHNDPAAGGSRRVKENSIREFQGHVQKMHRTMEHVMSYFNAELGVPCSLDPEGKLTFKGRFTPKQIESVVRKYMIAYVQCQMCKNFDSNLVKESATRLTFLECNRCGARMSVQNVEKGFHATNRSDRKAAKAAK